MMKFWLHVVTSYTTFFYSSNYLKNTAVYFVVAIFIVMLCLLQLGLCLIKPCYYFYIADILDSLITGFIL